jgi:hypothetical protein
MDYTPTVLKNKGIPCQFAKTQKTGAGESDWARVLDEKEEVVTETLFIRFNNNSISDIEEYFGGLESWQEQLEKKPYNTMRQTLAFVLRRPLHDVGEAMLDGEIITYSNVVGTAWSIANGVDPIAASRMLKQALALAEENKEKLLENLEQIMPPAQDNGTSGSDSGVKRAARSKNSGN